MKQEPFSLTGTPEQMFKQIERYIRQLARKSVKYVYGIKAPTIMSAYAAKPDTNGNLCYFAFPLSGKIVAVTTHIGVIPKDSAPEFIITIEGEHRSSTFTYTGEWGELAIEKGDRMTVSVRSRTTTAIPEIENVWIGIAFIDEGDTGWQRAAIDEIAKVIDNEGD